jgi:hypothetical protein
MTKRKQLLKMLASLLLAVMMVLQLCAVPSAAKTISSAKGENIFLYATDKTGKSVLVKVMTLDELKKISHGQSNGENYYLSTTDNYPTTQYCEARGFTLQELVDYAKSVTTVKGADSLSFASGDSISFMATDSYGNYNRSWSYDELYGEKRYYFEGLYDSSTGWKTGWEIEGEDNSKYGITLDEYNSKYSSSDPYYADKRTVFESGVEMPAILATESLSGRTTSETLVASTELGIASYIKANGGKVAGCLSNALTDDYALRLNIPMSEADLMSAHRTSYDNFKWIYNMKLESSGNTGITSLGTVAEPVPSFSLSGNTLTITFSCATSGASIYYGWDGAPQTLYTGPIKVDVSGRNLDSNPVTVYANAVKEGYDDAGVMTFKYPGMAPSFQTVYSGMTGSDLTFAAADGVSSADWSAWTNALSFITLKTPSVNGYATIDKSKYKINNTAKTITFDSSLFTETGSYSFVFHAAKYADKSVSVTMKKAAPTVSTDSTVSLGSPVTLSFNEAAYSSGLSIYVTPADGSRTLISGSYIDRTQSGKAVIKAEYFTAAGSAMSTAGTYTLELVNNSYSPSSQNVTVSLTGGGTSFTDVKQGEWYYSYVTELAGAGVINGVGNGLFKPSGTLTWGQSVKLLMLATGYDEQSPTGTHWASGYMDKAVADGIIPAGKNPDAAISRLEFCQSAAKALGLTASDKASPFTDTADGSVTALNEKGIIDGVGNGLFAPDKTLTRAQISKIIYLIRNMEA